MIKLVIEFDAQSFCVTSPLFDTTDAEMRGLLEDCCGYICQALKPVQRKMRRDGLLTTEMPRREETARCMQKVLDMEMEAEEEDLSEFSMKLGKVPSAALGGGRLIAKEAQAHLDNLKGDPPWVWGKI